MSDDAEWNTRDGDAARLAEADKLLRGRGWTEASPGWMSDICSDIAAALAVRDAALREHNAATDEVVAAAREVQKVHFRFGRIGDPIQHRLREALARLDEVETKDEK